MRETQRKLELLNEKFQKHQAQFSELRRQQEALAAGRSEADRLTAVLEAELELIADILVSGAPPRCPSFDELLRLTVSAPFKPGRLGVPENAPRWENFEPVPPNRVYAKLGGTQRHERLTVQRRNDFEAEQAAHAAREAVRLRRLNEARVRYDTAVARQRADDDAWNAEVERARAGFLARDAEAISWLVGHALAATDYPDW